MLSLLSLRLASRRALPLVVASARPTARPLAKTAFQSKTLTRLFLTSVFRGESSTPEPPQSTKTKSKSKTGSPSGRKPKKQASGKPDNKPKKKPAKLQKTVVPRSVKIPRTGPSDFTHFLSVYYNVDRPKMTTETMLLRTKEGAAAWAALPEYEKERISAEATELRQKAKEERKAFIASMDPKVLREINRRRVAKGKSRIVVHRDTALKKPPNQYFMFASDYRERHPELKREVSSEASKKLSEIWRNMSDAEKEPWVTSSKVALAEWHAERERLQEEAAV